MQIILLIFLYFKNFLIRINKNQILKIFKIQIYFFFLIPIQNDKAQ